MTCRPTLCHRLLPIFALIGLSHGIPVLWQTIDGGKMARSLGDGQGEMNIVLRRDSGDSDNNSSTALTIFWYLFGDRVVVLVVNLILGAIFLLAIASIPWLRRRNISFGWFRFFERFERGGHNGFEQLISQTATTISSHRSSLRRPATIFSFDTSDIPSPPSNPPSQISSTELRAPANTPMATTAAGGTSMYTSTMYAGSSSQSSRRWSLTTSARTQDRRRLEPVRSPFLPGAPRRDVDVTSSVGYTPSLSEFPTPPSAVETRDNSRVSLPEELADLRVPETPTSPAAESPSTDIDNSSPMTPGPPPRIRPPGYGSNTFSQISLTTLPEYHEADRMSVISRAPTYRSSVTVRGPRTPLRMTRPPLPPPSSYPLEKLQQ